MSDSNKITTAPTRPPRPLCSIEGCDKPVHVALRGWCNAHYIRWQRYGDPLGKPVKLSATQRCWGKVNRNGPTMPHMSTPCWVWTHKPSDNGYGTLSIGGRAGRTVYAHRYSYELHTGRPLDGRDVDHLCFNRICVNPSHLRATTRKQNVENHQGANRNSATGVRGGLEIRMGHLSLPGNAQRQDIYRDCRHTRRCRRGSSTQAN